MSRFFEQIMGVYFDDLDSFRILHNARYLLLFERTIGAFWSHVGIAGFDDPTHHDRYHFVRANQIEYITPVTGVGDVRVRVWIEKLGRTSLTFGFRIMPLHEDSDHARGSRTVVCVDPDTHKPTPWSDALRARVQPWIATVAP